MALLAQDHMNDLRPNLYPIIGGIGKCVAFTALIERILAIDGKKIAVSSGFPWVFKYHPHVGEVVGLISTKILTPKFANKFENIVMREPYISNYCKGNRHILDEWARLYGVEPLVNGGFHAQPDLYIPNSLISRAEKVLVKLKSKFIILQWTGGQPPDNLKRGGKYPENYFTKARNVRNYQAIMSALAEANPEHQLLLYALPNEPVQIPVHLKNRVIRLRAPALTYAVLLKYAESFVALDSSLHHFAAAKQVSKKGVVLWGGWTTPEQIGYSFHSNLQSETGEGVAVPPKQVVDALANIMSSKAVSV